MSFRAGTPNNPMPPFIGSFIRVGGQTLPQHLAKVERFVSAYPPLIETTAEDELDFAKSNSQKIVPVRTGYLRSTINWSKVGRYVFHFFASAAYALHVEKGTAWMPPRPYMLPSILQLQKRVPTAIVAAVTGLLH